MAQLWGGRFTKQTDKLVYNFNASISFDQKFYKQDIEGSIAHVRMLGKQGILTGEEMQAIVACLKEILADVAREEKLQNRPRRHVCRDAAGCRALGARGAGSAAGRSVRGCGPHRRQQTARHGRAPRARPRATVVMPFLLL